MSASQSFLSSPDYGYDYVLAVTQDSVSATALAFLGTKQPVVNVCYIYDDNGDPKRIAYEEFTKAAHGADPFNIPDSGSERDTFLTNLDEAGFYFGFRAAMGIPDGFEDATDRLPDIVTLGSTAGDPVTYRLLCKSILLVELKQIPHKKPVLQTFTQPKGPLGAPWLFTYQVPLVPATVKDNKAFLATPAFGNLPATVQTKLTDKPEDFTIRRLMFDFNKAVSGTRPEISGVDRVLREKLYEDFAIEYFTEMQPAADPIVAVTPATGSDPFAGLKTEFSVNPAPQPKWATLNYLCASGDHPLPAAKPFSWNWVAPDEPGQFDGVCVINRSILVDRLKSQLSGYVDQNCWLPQPVVIYVTATGEDVGFGVVNRTYNWQGKVPEALHQDFKLLEPQDNSVLLHWQFSATREDDQSYFHHGGGDSWMKVDTSFDLTVACTGKTVTIEQHVVVHYHLVMETLVEDTTLVDVTLTDAFTLAAAGDKVTGALTSSRADNSKEPAYWHLAPKLQTQMKETQAKVVQRISTAMSSVPLSFLNNVIFPGGKAFFFKEVGFSEHQDLVAHITYADPT